MCVVLTSLYQDASMSVLVEFLFCLLSQKFEESDATRYKLMLPSNDLSLEQNISGLESVSEMIVTYEILLARTSEMCWSTGEYRCEVASSE